MIGDYARVIRHDQRSGECGGIASFHHRRHLQMIAQTYDNDAIDCFVG